MRIWLGLFVLFAVGEACAQGYRGPTTPSGHPDLHGYWTIANITPLERPPGIASLVIDDDAAEKIVADIEGRISNRGVPNEAPEFGDVRHLQKLDGQYRSSLIVDPDDGKLPGTPLFRSRVADARAALTVRADNPEERPTSERCLASITASAPMLSVVASNMKQIIQTDDFVVIASEHMHDTRIIRIGAQPRPEGVTSWHGDSIGHWDGATLVVETGGFSASYTMRQGPMVMFAMAPESRVTERFTRISDAEIRYSFTVDDPLHYTRPWSVESHLSKAEGPVFEYACHEGNYAMSNVLRGARLMERR